MIGWDPKMEVGLPPSAEIDSKKVSFWAGLVADRPMAIYSGLKTKEYLDTRDPRFFKPVQKKKKK